ncbi:LysM peptidoglycan-binding domain-containing protein [Trinickia violacea]|uniref:LysM peptidoglycan-binding domain-containing protein n=1 Tax=Trinickia violacea TaxID=2571746 RepID=A0A4P8J3D7_9BURK|nr:FecR domain-containing protein [Trinickia violacea]QCP54364.1 LysM peptidoglycan-binding domain-containing protein [Trinickia violacea]
MERATGWRSLIKMRRAKLRRGALRRFLKYVLPIIAVFAEAASFGQDHTHVLRPGDTLWGIAGQYLQSPLLWPDIQRLNGVGDPKRLRPGMALDLNLASRKFTLEPSASPHGRQAADSAAWTRDVLAVAGIAELSGTATLKRGDALAQPLDEGTPVRAGDILETDEHTYLSFRLRDGSTLVMPSSSTVQVAVANGSATLLQLLDGRVDARVAKQHGRRFEIRSRTVALGVRGTHFRVRNEHGTVTAEVLTGVIAVSVDGHPDILLDAGHGTALAGAGALESRQLLPPPGLSDSRFVTKTLSAQPVIGASDYHLLLSTDPEFVHVVYEATAKDGVFSLPGDLPGGFYHARLSAFDVLGIEGVPNDTIVHIPDERQEDDVRRMSDGRYEIHWSAPLRQRCNFELARAADFASPIVSEPVVYGNGVVVGPIDVSGRYYWRVRAVTATGEPPIAAGMFDIQPSVRVGD